MRTAVALTVLLGVALVPPVAGADPPQPLVGVSDVSHALEGGLLIVSGLVRNLGTGPMARLVIDAAGYGAGGSLVTAGSDGIPWSVPAGAAERFTIALPLGRHLVREYVVQVSAPGLSRPLASIRRGVEVSLYREHLRSLVRVAGEVRHGALIVRLDAAGLPVRQVTVSATVLAFDPSVEHFRLLVLTLDLAPDRPTTMFLGTPHAILVSLRTLEVSLSAAWAD